MKLIGLMLTVLSLNVYAIGYQDVSTSFAISDRGNNGSRVYYNCDSVETATEAMLEKLGAIDYKVRCTGGLDRYGRMHLPAHVSINFSALNSNINDDTNLATALYTETIRDRNNCQLNNSLFKSLLPFFEIKDYSVKSCSLRTRTRITIEVIKEAI